ncbi:MAG: hypothetical protein RL336_1089 [Pseudomonadota bacterium]|jgi:LPS O-antigen subunit length determinant protein (WzzB/FepE family)
MSNDHGFNIDQEVDILEYLHALLRYKFRIVIAATLCAIVVFGISLTIEDQFTSTVTLAVNYNDKPGSAAGYKADNTLGLYEHDFLLDAANAHSNEVDRILSSMRSIGFVETFINENDMYPMLFKEHWDENRQAWKNDFKPDVRWASLNLNSIRAIDFNDDTELLKIHFTYTDPKLAAQLANNFAPSFNRYIKNKQTQIISKRRDFLNQRLSETDNLELKRSIFRMIESQLAAESLLIARDDYPLEVIQPALPALYKSSPQRKQWAAISFVGIFIMGVVTVLGSVLIGKIKNGLKQYDFRDPILHDDSPNNDKLGNVQLDEWIEK